MRERPEKLVYNLVYTEVAQDGPWDWERESTQGGSFDLWVDNDYPIDYAVYEGDYISVYGPIASREVSAVEVKFKNGEEVR
jgi:hypothetical protein